MSGIDSDLICGHLLFRLRPRERAELDQVMVALLKRTDLEISLLISQGHSYM